VVNELGEAIVRKVDIISTVVVMVVSTPVKQSVVVAVLTLVVVSQTSDPVRDMVSLSQGPLLVSRIREVVDVSQSSVCVVAGRCSGFE
jgi:hypothetical protein